MSDQWIKIALVGINPLMGGTLHGLIPDFEEERFNEDLWNGKPVKLYNPIQLQPVPQMDGTMAQTAVNLIKSVQPKLENDYITLNPNSIAWWGLVEEDGDWSQVVAGCIHGIATASPQDLNDLDQEGGSVILP